MALPHSKKTRALLGYLAAEPRASSRQALCDLLWDGPDDPRAALRWSLSKLRPILDSGKVKRLRADAAEVRLEPVGLQVDLAIVRALAARLDTAKVDELQRTVALCRGELLEALELPDCYRFHEWCVAEREKARALRLALHAALVARLADRPEEALVYARQWVGIDPLLEAGHAAVIQLLGKLGRSREAMDQYDSCRRILETTLGTRPSQVVEQARRLVSAPVAPAPAALRPARVQLPAVKSSPVIGRAAELAELARHAQALHLPAAPPVLLLEGDAGIGKSRMLEELADQVRAQGGEVVLGRAFEPERRRPFGAWIDALRSWKGLSVTEALRAKLLPILPELGGEPAAGEPAAVSIDQALLFDAVASALRAALARQPLAVILDDAHWLDEASVALLHYVIRELEVPQVMFACAARDGELVDNAPALQMVRALGRAGRLERLRLGRLDSTAIAALAQTVSPGIDAARIVAESDGNPLFTIELARTQGTATRDSLDALIGERMSRLDDKARELLPWAAALGRSFDPELLGGITGLRAAPLLSALEELERRGILRGSADGGTQGYDFTHDLVRQAAYAQTSAPRRRLIHAQIARAMAALPDPGDAHAGAVAHHAALALEHGLAAVACAAAGERCLRLFARTEAVDAAQRGLLHLESTASLQRVDRVRLELRLRALMVFSGRRSKVNEVSAALERLAKETEALGLLNEAAYAWRVLAEVVGDDPPRASRAIQHSAETSRRGGSATSAMWVANTARCLVMIEHDVSRAKVMLAELEVLPELGPARPEFLFGQGLLAAHLGRAEPAVEQLSASADSFGELQDRWCQCEALARLVMIEIEAGRPLEGLRRYEALLPVASRLTEGSERPYAEALSALCRLLLGEPGAEAHFDAAVDALRALDSNVHVAWLLVQAAEHALGLGETELAVARAQLALASAIKVGRRSVQVLARATLAEATLAQGDEPAAEAHLTAGLRELAAPEDLSARAQRAIKRAAEHLEGARHTAARGKP